MADLSKVWVMAQISDSDLATVRVGDTAQVETGVDATKLGGTVCQHLGPRGSRYPRGHRARGRRQPRAIAEEADVRPRADPVTPGQQRIAGSRSRRSCATTRTCRSSMSSRVTAVFARRSVTLGSRTGDQFRDSERTAERRPHRQTTGRSSSSSGKSSDAIPCHRRRPRQHPRRHPS